MSSVEERAEPRGDLVRAAFELHDAPPLGLRVPDRWDPGTAPETDVFWHAHAVAFEPRVQASRRAWRAALRRADGAGSPGRTGVAYRLEDADDLRRQNDLVATFDLLGLLGLGPRKAEEQVALGAVDLAFGELEEHIWAAVFEVDRARVGFAAAGARLTALRGLLAQALETSRRFELLHERGRLATGVIGRVRSIVTGLRGRVHHHEAAVARARERLARAAGLPPTAVTLDAVSAQLLAAERLPEQGPPSVPAAELLQAVPRLRAARFAYALAEARLRYAAAGWWPGLRVGPGLKIRPDEFLTGGVLALDLPWPARVSAQIEEAVELREQAREVIESDLVAIMARVRAATSELSVARNHQAYHAPVMESESLRTWHAVRARASVEETASAVNAWVDALNLRIVSVLGVVDSAEQVWLSDLSLRESSGLPPGFEGRAQP